MVAEPFRWYLLLLSCTGVGAWTLASGDRLPARSALGGPSRGLRTPNVNTVPASILDLDLVEEWCSARGLQPSHLRSVYRTLFRHGTAALDPSLLAKSDVPFKAATELCEQFVGCRARVVEARESAGGGRKLLVELGSGARVETVLIRHERRSTGRARHTVCVSSQAGCSRRCTFCATGSMGLQAQLSGADILEQVWLARELIAQDAAKGGEPAPLRNVVFMGMGEPLDNLENVLRALRGLSHMSLFALSPRQLTVSTVGASAAAIRKLAAAAPAVRLALSLHAASQPLRATLLPSAHDCSLDELTEALDEHARASGTGAMLEYLLIAGVNDRPEDAAALGAFCLARSAASGRAFVNLIPYNPTAPGAQAGYATPSDEEVASFHAMLRRAGVNALVRWTSAAGRDAEGACGQLALGAAGPARRARPLMSLTGGAGGAGGGSASGRGGARGEAWRMEGVKLATMVEELQARLGWRGLAEETGVRCFEPAARPTVKSALKFLRAVEHKWARERVEALWLEMKCADAAAGRIDAAGRSVDVNR